MRFSEVLNLIRNKFIRKNGKTEPEGDPEVSEEPEAPVKTEKTPEENSWDRQIRRYRAFAYHHKKKRIRKKYLKRLLDISPVDRFAYSIRSTGLTLEGIRKFPLFAGGQWADGSGARYFADSLNYRFQDMRIQGVKMIDHSDARIGGWVR